MLWAAACISFLRCLHQARTTPLHRMIQFDWFLLHGNHASPDYNAIRYTIENKVQFHRKQKKTD